MKKAYRFEFSQAAEKEFSNLPKPIQKLMFKKLNYFESANDPLSFASILVGTDNKFRFRVGDYRIIVSKIDQNVFAILLILKVAHRSKAYKA